MISRRLNGNECSTNNAAGNGLARQMLPSSQTAGQPSSSFRHSPEILPSEKTALPRRRNCLVDWQVVALWIFVAVCFAAFVLAI